MHHFTIFSAFVFIAICPNRVEAQTNDTQPDNPREVIRLRGEIFTTRTKPITVPLPVQDNAFHFAIYGDRTGGDPSGLKYLRQAVTDTNLMDPDFVMTVGDLIQGYNRPDQWKEQANEFKGIMSKLNMNWFPVAGNHDIYWDFRDRNRPNIHHEASFEEHFGPLWYSFKHKSNGFIALYSDEGDRETGEKGFNDSRLQNMSEEQLNFLEQALEKLGDCKQVFVFLHHPRWLGRNYDGSNWPEVHKRLVQAGNVSAVFGGHIHHMTFTGPVDGIQYYTLGATGGHIAFDSPELGYLHHFNIVTVRENDFQVATLPVGSVIDPKTFKMDFLLDVEKVRDLQPTRAGERLLIDAMGGARGDYTVAITNPGIHPIEVTLSPNLNGNWQAVPDHQHAIIPAGKSAALQFHFFHPPESNSAGSETGADWSDFNVPSFGLSIEYLHTSARIRLPDSTVSVDLGLKVPDDFAAETNGCLELRGTQTARIRRPLKSIQNDSARINFGDFELPQGAFTLEAWIRPTKHDRSRGIVCNTQSSGYALFLHNGLPQFDVHLDGSYVSPAGDEKITLDSWTHVAGVYDGSSAKLFLNGKLTQSLPASGARTQNQLPLYIGADPDGYGNPSREFAGQIDEVRLSKVARYTAEFEPQLRFQSDENTVVLLHLDQKFGPFLINASQSHVPALIFGKAQITPRK